MTGNHMMDSRQPKIALFASGSTPPAPAPGYFSSPFTEDDTSEGIEAPPNTATTPYLHGGFPYQHSADFVLYHVPQVTPPALQGGGQYHIGHPQHLGVDNASDLHPAYNIGLASPPIELSRPQLAQYPFHRVSVWTPAPQLVLSFSYGGTQAPAQAQVWNPAATTPSAPSVLDPSRYTEYCRWVRFQQFYNYHANAASNIGPTTGGFSRPPPFSGPYYPADSSSPLEGVDAGSMSLLPSPITLDGCAESPPATSRLSPISPLQLVQDAPFANPPLPSPIEHPPTDPAPAEASAPSSSPQPTLDEETRPKRKRGRPRKSESTEKTTATPKPRRPRKTKASSTTDQSEQDQQQPPPLPQAPQDPTTTTTTAAARKRNPASRRTTKSNPAHLDAAKKSRERLRENERNLEIRGQQLAARNDELKAEQAAVQAEVYLLRDEMLTHAGCGDLNISNWINHRANAISTPSPPPPQSPTLVIVSEGLEEPARTAAAPAPALIPVSVPVLAPLSAPALAPAAAAAPAPAQVKRKPAAIAKSKAGRKPIRKGAEPGLPTIKTLAPLNKKWTAPVNGRLDFKILHVAAPVANPKHETASWRL